MRGVCTAADLGFDRGVNRTATVVPRLCEHVDLSNAWLGQENAIALAKALRLADGNPLSTLSFNASWASTGAEGGP